MKKITVSFLSCCASILLFSCVTSENISDSGKKPGTESENVSEKTVSTKVEEMQSDSLLPIPKNDGLYSEAYSWRTKKEEPAMVSVRNSDVDSIRFSNVDRYVSEVAAIIERSSKNDFQKVKMVHDIIALTIRYDAQGFWSNNIPSQDYASVLRRGTAVCEGFSNVFKRFCDVLKIPCRIVHGYARGVGTKIGEESRSYMTNHAWNIVTIGGRQYQVDCTWDEGYMDGYSAVHSYRTTWLFAQPETYIYTHFTDSPADQLLKIPFTYQKFLQLPSLRPNFFDAVSDVQDFGIVNRCNGKFSLFAKLRNGKSLTCTVIENGSSSFTNNADFFKVSDSSLEMLFSLPKARLYDIALFYQDSEMEKADYCGEFVIESTAASSVRYPTVYKDYGLDKDGIVISPVEAPLVRGKSYDFIVQSRFSDVQVVIDKQWTKLESDGNGKFSGAVEIPSSAQKIGVYVKNATGSYWSIVSYELR